MLRPFLCPFFNDCVRFRPELFRYDGGVIVFYIPARKLSPVDPLLPFIVDEILLHDVIAFVDLVLDYEIDMLQLQVLSVSCVETGRLGHLL